MTKRAIFLVTLIAMTAPAAMPAAAQDGGMLKTMPHGRYECALPGDATGAAWEPVPEASFKLSTASSYSSKAGRGTYMMKGKDFTFTRGPMKGIKLRRTGTNELQAVESDGSLGRMICVRQLRGG